jgi:beta-lactamase regulating signal transducer with metallopeptidase domain
VIFVIAKWLAGSTHNAAVRHLAWTIAFTGVCALPLCQAISFALHEVTARAPFPPAPAEQTSVHHVGPPTDPGVCPSTPGTSFQRAIMGWVVLAVWMSGTIWTLTRAGVAKWKLQQWRAQSQPYQPGPVEFDDRGIRPLPIGEVDLRIALQDKPVVPITWGARNPVILLPASARAWSPSRLFAVLLHETGHIRRFDNLTQQLALLTCAIHWFNPLFWKSARLMEAEAEIAADDYAISRGMKPSRYATELLALASQLTAQPRIFPTFAQTSMVDSLGLEQRLRAVIHPGTCRGPASCRSVTALLGVITGFVVALALLTPSAVASLKAHTMVTASCCLPAPR